MGRPRKPKPIRPAPAKSYKSEDAVFGGIKAPLEGVDRSKLPGFAKYFAARPIHFLEQFKTEYSTEAVKAAFASLNKEV
jgi:hypothetical protein